MWRVQRLDQINAFNPANLFDFKSLALKIRKKQIGRFKTVIQAQPTVSISKWLIMRGIDQLCGKIS
jgi:hypothetical protein